MISETTLNVLLAELLEKRGLFGASELIFKRREKVRKPDVLVRIQGVRVVVEGKILKPTAKQELSAQCVGRIDEGLADVGIGVIYKLQHPESLIFSNVEVKKMLEGSTFEVAVWSASAAGPRAVADWTEVELDSLVRLVRSSVNEAASQDLLREAVNQMREALDRAVETLMQETMDKFAQLAKDLAGLIEVPEPKKDEEFVRAVKMALLVLMDAIIFYNVVAPGAELPSLESLKKKRKSLVLALQNAFDKALRVNYVPVFDVSARILKVTPAYADRALQALADTAFFIASSKALLRHDLMGRVYHRLLFQEIAKHLATYYTSVPSAWLLARLAVESMNSEFNWASLEHVGKLRIADLACGSGTLLSAAYQAIEDQFLLNCSANDIDPDRNSLHKVLIEEVLSGLDVMTYAAHIATVTLALHNPEAIFERSNIFVASLAGARADLGSANLLELGSEVGGERYGVVRTSTETLKVPPNSYDLIIMNPPFARSCGDNLLFGSITNKSTRDRMKKRLSDAMARIKFKGIGQAGLGAVFVVLADKYVKRGGRISFVLPRNLLSGVSWEKIRKLLASPIERAEWDKGGYHLEYVLLSAQKGSYNFSENTDLSECLFVARKLKENESAGKTTAVIFHAKPRNVFESLSYAEQILGAHRTQEASNTFDIFENVHAWPLPLRTNSEAYAKSYTFTAEALSENVDNWGRLVAFANPELTKVSYILRQLKELILPGGPSITIPLVPLNKIAEVGPDRRQIHNVFEFDQTHGVIQTVWGRTMSMDQMTVAPTGWLAASSKTAAEQLMALASPLMIAERVRLNTTPLVTLMCTQSVLSNVWWSVKGHDSSAEKILTLWLNCTPGLLLYLAELEVTEGGWVAMKKGPLESLAVLPPEKLREAQRKTLLDLFDRLHAQHFPLLKEQFREGKEGRGLRFQLDSELLTTLAGRRIGKDEISPLYSLLSQESEHWESPPAGVSDEED